MKTRAQGGGDASVERVAPSALYLDVGDAGYFVEVADLQAEGGRAKDVAFALYLTEVSWDRLPLPNPPREGEGTGNWRQQVHQKPGESRSVERREREGDEPGHGAGGDLQ